MPPPSAPRRRRPAPRIKVEVRAVDELVPDPENPMKHGEQNLLAIRGSLRKFGQQKLLVISRDGIVVAGNGTLAAAVLEGWEWIECKVFDGDAAAARAYAIADNQSAKLAEWEEQMLAATLRELSSELREATGFTELEIDRLLQPDDAPLDTRPGLGEMEYRLIVECKSERQQQDLLEKLEAEGYECRAVMS